MGTAKKRTAELIEVYHIVDDQTKGELTRYIFEMSPSLPIDKETFGVARTKYIEIAHTKNSLEESTVVYRIIKQRTPQWRMITYMQIYTKDHWYGRPTFNTIIAPASGQQDLTEVLDVLGYEAV